MNCKNCGEPFESGTLFCENCGARLYKSSASHPAHTSSKKRKKKRLTGLGVLFVTLGSALILALTIAIVLLIRNNSRSPGLQQVESDDTQATFSVPGEFASAEEKTAYWQSVYRSYLVQLIPERMSASSIAPVLWFALVDMNGDGTPELVDCFIEDGVSDPYSLSVYYIDGGAIRLLGTADVDIGFTPAFYVFKDKTLGTVCYISGVDVSISDESRHDYCLWGCQNSGGLYFEHLFFQQSSPNQDRLLELADSDAIYYDSETDLYTISVYQGVYVPPDVLEDAMDAFANQLERLPQQINWFRDGSEDGSYPSHYTELMSAGMTAVSAANELIDSIFQTYSSAENKAGEGMPVSP